ncbi:MAG: glycosyltransferase family A protein [Halioglobus sp.]|nr:glycosyltransferase family A protein [Halioglobus sp.]
MKLSVLLICYNMAREIPRTLQGLSRTYQQDIPDLDYEVLLTDNGSPVPLDPSTWSHVDVPVRMVDVADPQPSPAAAINTALAEARGELVCVMIDGAHILTPGVFRLALAAFAAFENPVVATRYFWLGPDAQNISIEEGYDQEVEDGLLRRIGWPDDGYRLFEIGSPLRNEGENINWLNRLFESNCFFMPRTLFEELGGADERFDFPGGGFINSDIFKRAVDHPRTTPVQLIGEGCFHQVHGGTTTNISTEQRNAQLERYRDQYEAIRGDRNIITQSSFSYLGHVPTEAAKIHRWRKRRL